MTKLRLLSSAAAALLLGASAASAQSIKAQAPERAPAAQQQAPAEKMAPPMKAGEPKAPETTGQAPKESAPGRGQDARPDAGAKGSLDINGNAGMKAKGGYTKRDADMTPKSDSKVDTKAEGSSSQSGQSASEKTTGGSIGEKSSSNSASEQSTSSTTGQGAAAGAVKLSTEQRTKITTVIKSQKVQRVEPSQLNVSISVGTKVPSSVRYYPVPAEVVTIYPEWRGYYFILVGEQIVIIEPRTREIVFILEA